MTTKQMLKEAEKRNQEEKEEKIIRDFQKKLKKKDELLRQLSVIDDEIEQLLKTGMIKNANEYLVIDGSNSTIGIEIGT